MRYARSGSRARWDSELPSDSPIPSDCLVDFRTQDNSLSLWGAGDGAARDEVVVALAAAAERPRNIDLVWIDSELLASLEIETHRTPGETPYEAARPHHVDVTGLTVESLSRLVSALRRRPPVEVIERIRERQVLELMRDRIKAGTLELNSLQPPVAAGLYRDALRRNESAFAEEILGVLADFLAAARICEHDLDRSVLESLRSLGLVESSDA